MPKIYENQLTSKDLRQVARGVTAGSSVRRALHPRRNSQGTTSIGTTQAGGVAFSLIKIYIECGGFTMEMTTVQLQVPVDMEPYIATKPEGELVQLALLLHPFVKNETISHGRAAEILGITKWQLIELYANEGFAYFDMDWDEVEEDVATYERLKAKEAATV